jgi:hypothetical protein
LAFRDFPAEHWKHLRTTNVIESSFATLRYHTLRSKGCLSNKTALAMIFKLAGAAEKSWRRLDGHNQLPIPMSLGPPMIPTFVEPTSSPKVHMTIVALLPLGVMVYLISFVILTVYRDKPDRPPQQTNILG